MQTRVLYCLVALMCVGSAAFTQGRTGMALRFDGDADYLWIPDAPSLRCVTGITVETRVCAQTFTRTDRGPGTPFFNKWKTSHPSQGAWSLAMDTSGQGTFIVSLDGQSGATRAVSSERLERNKWTHVAATYSVATNTMQIFLDGELRASMPGPAGLFDADSPILVGAAIYDLPYIRSWFKGAVDELRLWNVVRTQRQIRATMDVPLPSIYYASADSGLVGYWPCDAIEDLRVFDDGEDDIRDLSIYKNHGDLSGNPILVPGDTPLSAGRAPRAADPGLTCSPQPVSTVALIRYTRSTAGPVSLRICDALGRTVELFETAQSAIGDNAITWPANALPAGMYYLVLHAQEGVKTARIVVVR